MTKFNSRRNHNVSRQKRSEALSPKSKQLSLQIHDLSTQGQGVGRLGRDVYFVPGALVGETVKVEVTGRSKKIWQCRLIEVEQVSEQRVEPACAHYKKCGGCDLQHLDYQSQISFKQQRVAKELERQKIVIAEDAWQSPISGDSWHYRRRARLGVRYNKQKQRFYIGFRESQNQHLTNVVICPVLVEHSALIWSDWHDRLAQLESKERVTHIEVLQADNRLVLAFRVLKQLPDHDQKLFAQWAQVLDIDIYWRDDAQQLIPLVSEPQSLHHQVLGHELKISPDYFVQVNRQVNVQMVDRAIDWLAPAKHEHVWDLFAGHGNFSLPLAQKCQVSAVEVSDEMVNALQMQAAGLNVNSQQLTPIKADLTDAKVLGQLTKPDAVLLDPPRAGAQETLATLLAAEPERMVYVSCDPATLARDLVELSKQYKVEKICILDMFPHTHHVETMVLLKA